MKNLFKLTLLSVFMLTSMFAVESSLLNSADSKVKVSFEIETGTVGVLSHTYQSGRTEEGATRFDYVKQGGQDVLFPFDRYVANITIKEKHKISLMYQPLKVTTNVTFRDDVMVDSVLFSKGTPMELSYGFPFYRITYSYSFINSENFTLAGGLALQARNANIVFKALDGTAMTVANNVGPVPSLNLNGRYDFNGGAFLGFEVTGLYASSAIINGASFAFEGSILDASLRGGYTLIDGLDVFANFRFLGGTSKGESQYIERNWSETNERYGINNLATSSFTLGISLY
ncbi:MAG: hypothetical protein WCT23_00920 [Candidatus Neomarinimicrobiota bacterium]